MRIPGFTWMAILISSAAFAVEYQPRVIGNVKFPAKVRELLKQKAAKYNGHCNQVLNVSELSKPLFFPPELAPFKFVKVLCEKSELEEGWPQFDRSQGVPSLHLVGTESDVYSLPRDYEMVMRKARVNVDTNDRALNVARTYLWFYRPVVEPILSRAEDIPGWDRNTKEAAKLSAKISPPSVRRHENEFKVSFTTWDHGRVIRWALTILNNATVHEDSSEVLATSVGDYRVRFD